MAHKEGLCGILSAVLADAHPESAPLLQPSVRQVHEVFAANAKLWILLKSLAQGLHRRSLDAVLLKGAALLCGPYRHRLSLRPLSDLDILVPTSQEQEAADLLRSLGLNSPSPESGLFLSEQGAVDLHLDLIGTRRIRSRQAALRLPTADLFRDSLPIDALPGLRILSPEHQFLHLAFHGLKHSYERLIWVVDLALAWPSCNPDRLLKSAQAYGMQRPTLYALRLLRDLWQVDGTEDPIARLGRTSFLEEQFLKAVTKRSAEHVGPLVLGLSVSGSGQRWAYLCESAFLRKEVLADIYPGTPYPAALLRRCLSLGKRGLSECVR